MRDKILIGIDPMENTIVLAEIELTNRNGYKEFTACFDIGQAFDINEIDKEYIENYLLDEFEWLDDKTKLDLLQEGEITKYEYASNTTYDVDYIYVKDCSCTDLEIALEDTTINFETISCGQHDIRKDENFNNFIFTNKQAVEKLLLLWDEYHLKNVENNEEFKKEYNFVIENLEKYDFYDINAEEFIKKNINYDII